MNKLNDKCMLGHGQRKKKRSREQLFSRRKNFGQDQIFSGSDHALFGKKEVTHLGNNHSTIHKNLISAQKQLSFNPLNAETKKCLFFKILLIYIAITHLRDIKTEKKFFCRVVF